MPWEGRITSSTLAAETTVEMRQATMTAEESIRGLKVHIGAGVEEDDDVVEEGGDVSTVR